MGWTWSNRDVPVKEYLEREFRNDNWRIIDAAIVNRTEYYAAAEYVRDGGTAPKGTVFALVCMLGYSRGEFNFGYKDMDETVGPNQDNCPKRILDRLTPTDHGYAKAWRERCRAKHAKPRPKPGQTVRFTTPIEFANGDNLSLFRYVKGSRFESLVFENSLCFYRISGWKDRDYTVVVPDEA